MEAGFGRCIPLAFCLLLLTAVCVAGAAAAASVLDIPDAMLPVTVLLILGAYMLIGVLATRRILKCRWRSTVTVLVMTTFVAKVITFIAALVAVGVVSAMASAGGATAS